MNKSDKLLLRILRKSIIIDKMLDRSMRMVNKHWNICERDFDFFLKVLNDEICEVLGYDYFKDVEEESEEFELVKSLVMYYLRFRHLDYINSFYSSKC